MYQNHTCFKMGAQMYSRTLATHLRVSKYCWLCVRAYPQFDSDAARAMLVFVSEAAESRPNLKTAAKDKKKQCPDNPKL